MTSDEQEVHTLITSQSNSVVEEETDEGLKFNEELKLEQTQKPKELKNIKSYSISDIASMQHDPSPIKVDAEDDGNYEKVSSLETHCEMCENYETQLQKTQSDYSSVLRQCHSLQKSSDRYEQELQKERNFREKMETTLTSAVEESQFRASNLYDLVKEQEKQFERLRMEQKKLKDMFKADVDHLIKNCDETRRKCDFLEKQNSDLRDLHGSLASELDEEEINLSNNVYELHEEILKIREELIRNKVGKEYMKNELATVKQQLESERDVQVNRDNELVQEIYILKDKINILENDKLRLQGHRENASTKTKELEIVKQDLVAEKEGRSAESLDMKEEIKKLISEKNTLEVKVAEQKSQIHTLQESIECSEHVQMDFVKVNQELQRALEKIRQEENELRWQFEDDVHQCDSCKTAFSSLKRSKNSKVRCLHCGKIFCTECLKRDIVSGPNKRTVKVCDICHTLLSSDSRPYFLDAEHAKNTNGV